MEKVRDLLKGNVAIPFEVGQVSTRQIQVQKIQTNATVAIPFEVGQVSTRGVEIFQLFERTVHVAIPFEVGQVSTVYYRHQHRS